MISLKGKLTKKETLSASIKESSRTAGTNDYNQLANKPTINGVELKGDLTLEVLKIQSLMKPISNTEIDQMFK